MYDNLPHQYLGPPIPANAHQAQDFSHSFDAAEVAVDWVMITWVPYPKP